MPKTEKKRSFPESPLKDCWVVIEQLDFPNEIKTSKRTRSSKQLIYNEESTDSDEIHSEQQNLDQQTFKNYIDITPFKGRGRYNSIRSKEKELYDTCFNELKELVKGKTFCSKTTDSGNKFVQSISEFLWINDFIRIPFPKNWGENYTRNELLVVLAKTKARAQLSVFPVKLFALPETIGSNEKLYFLP